MIAVFVNCVAVILGSALGLFVTKKMTDEYSDIIQTGAGVVTTVLGLQMAFGYKNIVYFSLALIVGGIAGTKLDLDGKVLSLGHIIQNLMPGKKTKDAGESQSAASNKNFAYAFLNASVLFCAGAMAIVGSFKAAIEHDYTIIFTKSILDGFVAISFAAAMGPGTAFSALSILVYQGSLTLLGAAISNFISENMIAEISAVGGGIILLLGINLLKLRQIKAANFLPAIAVIVLLVLGDPFFAQVFQIWP